MGLWLVTCNPFCVHRRYVTGLFNKAAPRSDITNGYGIARRNGTVVENGTRPLLPINGYSVSSTLPNESNWSDRSHTLLWTLIAYTCKLSYDLIDSTKQNNS